MKKRTLDSKKFQVNVGAQSRRWLQRLARVESPNVTYASEHFPIVMSKARGMRITDVDGRRYLDFTSCFGVLALGHGSPVVARAIRKQMPRLIHGMGDVHPSAAKVLLLEELLRFSPYDSAQGLLSLSGADAVEAGLKTAILSTGRHKFLSFAGGYHGLTMAPLSLTDRPLFREGFVEWLGDRNVVLPFPILKNEWDLVTQHSDPEAVFRQSHQLAPDLVLQRLEDHLRTQHFAGLVMEPLQGRGGERDYPDGFVAECATLCKKYGTRLIFDEVFSGFGRTGLPFAGTHHKVTADILCVGKALGGGLPLSACVSPLMDVWGRSSGEARHTSTFLGHPLACAVGTAVLQEITTLLHNPPLIFSRAKELLQSFVQRISSHTPVIARGRGLMLGLWFFKEPAGFAAQLAEALLPKGFILLPSGMRGDVLALTPSFICTEKELQKLLLALEETVKNIKNS